MKTHEFKLDSPKAHVLKIASGLIMGVGMIPLLFMALGSMDGGNDLSDWPSQWWPVGAVLLVGGAIWAIYLSFWYQSELILTQQSNTGLELFIRDPNGDETRASGTWKWYAYFTKEYARYGIYKKIRHLLLFHKERAYIEFRTNGDAFDDPQLPFIEMPGELNINVQVYRTKQVQEILDVFARSPEAQQIIPGMKSDGGNPGIRI